MEAARTLPFSSTRSVGTEVVIDGLRVDDDTLARLVREREQAHENPDALVRDALAIGARILQRELTGAETDLVKTEFEGLKGSITDHTKRLADRMDEKVKEVFDADGGEFARLVAKHFGDESSTAVQHRVKAVMAEAATQLREDMRKQLASESDDNPLAKFHRVQMAVAESSAKRHGDDMRALTEKLDGMRLEVEKLRGEREKLEEVAAEAEKGTAKGRSYEEQVYEALDTLACSAGDDCEALGDFGGVGGKKGDIVVAIGASAGPAHGRIVFEAKNRQLSRNAAMAELDGALATRSADFAVLVVPSAEKLPAKTQPLREYNGDKLLVVFDPESDAPLALEVAYGLARARVLMRRGDNEGVDTEALNIEVEKALASLEEVRRIKQKLTAAKTAIDDSANIVDVMASGVRAHLTQISALMAAAEIVEDAA